MFPTDRWKLTAAVMLVPLVYAAGWLPVLRSAAPPAVGLPLEPSRVVSLEPAMTEIVFAIGGGDRMVGRSDYCFFPAAASKLPAAGGYYDPRVESLVRLRPDLVLARSSAVWLIRRCHELGIAVCKTQPVSVAGILQAIRSVGDALGGEQRQRGHALADQLQSRLQASCLRSRRWLDGRSPTVLWILTRDRDNLRRMFGTGPRGHRHELLLKAGYRNALQNALVETPTLSPEIVLKLRPDVIIDDISWTGGTADEARGLWRRWLSRPELSHTRLCVLTRNEINYPGPRMGPGLDHLLELLQQR